MEKTYKVTLTLDIDQVINEDEAIGRFREKTEQMDASVFEVKLVKDS